MFLQKMRISALPNPAWLNRCSGSEIRHGGRYWQAVVCKRAAACSCWPRSQTFVGSVNVSVSSVGAPRPNVATSSRRRWIWMPHAAFEGRVLAAEADQIRVSRTIRLELWVHKGERFELLRLPHLQLGCAGAQLMR